MTLQYTSPTAFTDLLTDAELQNLNDATASALSAATMDNTGGSKILVDFLLQVGNVTTALDSGGTFDLYLVPSPDGGTTYADAEGVDELASYYVGNFTVDNTNATQTQVMERVSIGPFMYQAFAINNTGQITKNTSAHTKIQYRWYSYTDA